jgi:signal transduction histidine kinase
MRSDGSTFPILLSASRLSGGENLIDYILVLRDISEQIQNNYELEGIKQRLDYAERMATLGTIGSILVHKLNQPLTAIQLFLQQGLRELKNTKNNSLLLRRNLEDCLKEAVSISTIVRSMAATQITTASQKESFDLASLLNRVITILTPEAERTSVTIHTSGLLDKYPSQGTRIELEELFYIIIKNSIQAFRGPGGQIGVTLKSKESQYIISIQDNGPGIAKDDIDHVFEMYFSTKGKDGCGLGLCIARQVIKNHNGELRLSSNPGEGTTIELILPFLAE